jgi:hypothetical protein
MRERVAHGPVQLVHQQAVRQDRVRPLDLAQGQPHPERRVVREPARGGEIGAGLGEGFHARPPPPGVMTFAPRHRPACAGWAAPAG